MKKFMIVLILISWCSYSFAENKTKAPEGFFDIKWGMTFDEAKSIMIKKDYKFIDINKGKASNTYDFSGTFNSQPITTTLFFFKNAYAGAVISFKNISPDTNAYIYSSIKKGIDNKYFKGKESSSEIKSIWEFEPMNNNQCSVFLSIDDDGVSLKYLELNRMELLMNSEEKEQSSQY